MKATSNPNHVKIERLTLGEHWEEERMRWSGRIGGRECGGSLFRGGGDASERLAVFRLLRRELEGAERCEME